MYVCMYVCVCVCVCVCVSVCVNRCPQAGCREFLPFQRMLGGGGGGWENMSVVWDGWQGRCEGGDGGGEMDACEDEGLCAGTFRMRTHLR